MRSSPIGQLDVPTPVTAALLVMVLVVVLPGIVFPPSLPDALPPLSYDAAAVVRAHAGPPPPPAPTFLRDAWAVAMNAFAARNDAAMESARRNYAGLVADVTHGDREKRVALREFFLREFLGHVDAGDDVASVRIAMRHRVAGPVDWRVPGVQRAEQIAWFEMRWEALAAPELVAGGSMQLDEAMARLPEADNRALVAWLLRADCAALLGRNPVEPVPPTGVSRCAEVRRDALNVAQRLDPAYPRTGADGIVDVMAARELQTLLLAPTPETTPVLFEIRAALEESLRRANVDFDAVVNAETGPGPRRFRRWWTATGAVGGGEP